MKLVSLCLCWWRSTKTPAGIAFRRPWPSTRRGFLLGLLSWAVIILGGINYVATDLPPTNRESLAFALSIAPAEAWGWLMITLGLFALWTSYCHLGRDRLGFVLLSGFCAFWASGYVCGVLFFDASARALGASVIWWIFAAVLATGAGFPSTPLHRTDRASEACRPDQGA